MVKEILVLGDSLSFGRPKYSICRDKTWPYLLRHELDSLLCMRACGGATSNDVLKEVSGLDDYWFDRMPARRFNAAFVQVGIVGVVPRLVPKRFYPYATRIPGFFRLLRLKRLHDLIGRPWVSSDQFTQSIFRIEQLLGRMADQVFFIEIAMPEHYLKENVGDFSTMVSRRNLLIANCVGESRFISCWEGVPVPQFLLPDGHHLNEKGHKMVASKCLERIL